MAYTLNAVTLNIKKETVRMSANLDVITVPGQAPSQAYVIDTNGSKTEITLEGVITEVSDNALINSIASLANLISGNQSSTIAYNSDTFSVPITVKVDEFGYDYSLTDTGLYTIFYTLKLIRSQ